ncbi:hypothetical protein ACX8Z9_04580 [Arthrobacter halodurans]|uniref:Uncharacterized protein n=1 Tax=Arthrobacter halodurans TaxID=516699 RepID=A0ABV4UPU5_9MICC
MTDTASPFITPAVTGAAQTAAGQYLVEASTPATFRKLLDAHEIATRVTAAVAGPIATAVRLHDIAFIEKLHHTDEAAGEGWTGQGQLSWDSEPGRPGEHRAGTITDWLRLQAEATDTSGQVGAVPLAARLERAQNAHPGRLHPGTRPVDPSAPNPRLKASPPPPSGRF